MKSLVLAFMFIVLSVGLFAQKKKTQFPENRYFIGTSAFILINLVPDQQNPPGFFQLNFGYWFTQKDVISVEAITWKYNAPLGIPYGDSFDNPDESYPGYVRSFGIGMAYQRYLWKKMYVAGHALPLLQQYNHENDKAMNGFQLFLTLRLGYHISLFKDHFFIEPSVAFTHWPVNTNVPDDFAQKESQWPDYFLFEPGLHCGFKF